MFSVPFSAIGAVWHSCATDWACKGLILKPTVSEARRFAVQYRKYENER